MWTRWGKYIVGSEMVALATLLLFLGLLTRPAMVLFACSGPVYFSLMLSHFLVGHRQPFLFFSTLVLLTLCQLGLIALPTLGVLRSRGEALYFWLVVQFIVLVFYALATAVFLSRPW